MQFCLEESGRFPSGAQAVPGRESSTEGRAGDHPAPTSPTQAPLSLLLSTLAKKKSTLHAACVLGLLWNTTLNIFIFDQKYLMKIHAV